MKNKLSGCTCQCSNTCSRPSWWHTRTHTCTYFPHYLLSISGSSVAVWTSEKLVFGCPSRKETISTPKEKWACVFISTLTFFIRKQSNTCRPGDTLLITTLTEYFRKMYWFQLSVLGREISRSLVVLSLVVLTPIIKTLERQNCCHSLNKSALFLILLSAPPPPPRPPQLW